MKTSLTCVLLFFISFNATTQRGMLIGESNSPLGSHLLFHPIEKSLPIFNHFIKQNHFKHSSTQFNTSLTNFDRPDFDLPKEFEVLNSSVGFFQIENQFINIKKQTILTSNGLSFTFFLDSQNECIHYQAHNLHAFDTTIVGTVFKPDPLTSSLNFYGGKYIDNDDQTNSSLDEELYEVLIPAQYENGYFILANKHLRIIDQSLPNIDPIQRVDSIFKFDRSLQGFEEVNALYHITNFAIYVKDTLNFTSIVNYQIPVDVYAKNGADQSEFLSTTNPPRLNFGQGNVDDAEDADVLIHEYAHAISHSAAPNTLSGPERRALEEGIGDYFAAAYSKNFSDFNYKNIFTWDGHNEFWSGRSINKNGHYPEAMVNQIYSDGDLFASVLMEIRDNIEYTTADQLIIQSMYSWFPQMTFRDASRLILQSDTLLNNHENSGLINWLLCKRGFLNNSCENGIKDDNWNPKLNYNLLNQGFLKVNNLLTPQPINIFSIDGKLLMQTEIYDDSINLNAYSKGIYILQIGRKSIKFLL
ncbi:hypothetical protein N8089_00050 [Flavobacteriales bacterium]|nr:hypothetical protein [Flavobacteriales bacterium]